jgi:hypothetical protein
MDWSRVARCWLFSDDRAGKALLLAAKSVVTERLHSGCSTLLKTIAGETHGFYVDHGSVLNYQGPNVPLLIAANCSQLTCRYFSGNHAS